MKNHFIFAKMPCIRFQKAILFHLLPVLLLIFTGDRIAGQTKLWGTTGYGGSSNTGVLFEYDPAGGGTYIVLHDFDITNGAYPLGELLEFNGKFYGMTSGGGSSEVGVIF